MTDLPKRALGRTGLEVSALGFGAGPLGDVRMSEHGADALVGAALDHGITMFDSAPSYGSSEERLGRALGPRRRDVILATKGGYGVSGVPDWTGEVLRLGIEAALTRLRTDVIDVFILHSCDAATLERDDLFTALARAKQAGKIRAAGYSGENHALSVAIRCGQFDVVECSVSPFDRGVLDWAIPDAAARGLGVLAKRPLANGAWQHASAPEAPDVRSYWERSRALAIDPAPLSWPELCVRFAVFAAGVTSALVGTSRAAHLAEAVAAVAAGPLDGALRARVDHAWKNHGAHWPGVI